MSSIERGSNTSRRRLHSYSGLSAAWIATLLGASAALAQSEAQPAATAEPTAPTEPTAPSEPTTTAQPEANPSPAAFVDLDAAALESFDAYIETMRAAFDVPGAAVALIADGDLAYAGAFGARGLDDPSPVDTATRFMIGSITKSMTTTLAAELASQGSFAWDDPIRAYLPRFEVANPEWSPRVTLRDAFGHTSGVPRYDIALFVDAPRPGALIAAVPSFGAVAPPGERYEYQNQVFTTGAFAAARAAGASPRDGSLLRAYARLMREHVFEPLALERTTLDFDAAVSDPNHALPHGYGALTASVEPVPLGFERFALPIAPSGAVWSDVSDMAEYFAMHLREGRDASGAQLFSPDELLETHAPHAAVGEGQSYGLGWITSESPEGQLIAHDGGTTGFTARVLGFPAQDWGLVVLTNSSGAFPFIEAVTRRAYLLALGLPPADDTDLLELHALAQSEYAGLVALTSPVDPATTTDLVGAYERGLRVEQGGESLLLHTVYGTHELRAFTGVEDVFVVVDNVLPFAFVQFTTEDPTLEAAARAQPTGGGAGGVQGSGGAVQSSARPSQRTSLTLGFVNGQTGEFVSAITAAQVEERRGPRRHRRGFQGAQRWDVRHLPRHPPSMWWTER